MKNFKLLKYIFFKSFHYPLKNQSNSNEGFHHETYPHHPGLLRISDNYLGYSLMV